MATQPKTNTNDKPPAQPAATTTYVAATPILFNGDLYQEGDEIELDAKQAKALGGKVAPATAK